MSSVGRREMVGDMEADIEPTGRKSSKKMIVIKAIVVLTILALFLVVLMLSVGNGT